MDMSQSWTMATGPCISTGTLSPPQGVGMRALRLRPSLRISARGVAFDVIVSRGGVPNAVGYEVDP
jgi:hypothetical protein